jgi:hypothetical protein
VTDSEEPAIGAPATDEHVVGEQTYPVNLVAGHVPRRLDEFLGATTVTVRSGDHEKSLAGTGVVHRGTVEFIEKDLASADDHPSTWRVVRPNAAQFTMEPAAD